MPAKHPTTRGLLRDDAGRFPRNYEHKGLLPQDLFVTIDPHGAGELVRIVNERSPKTRPDP